MKTASGRRCDSGLAREEVFLTTKFFPGHRDPVAEAEHSLRRLGVDHVDLYIIRWPQGGPTWAWPGMEQAQQRGYARSIGVSNFSVREIDQVMAIATTPPAVNQVQCPAGCSPRARSRGRRRPPGGPSGTRTG